MLPLVLILAVVVPAGHEPPQPPPGFRGPAVLPHPLDVGVARDPLGLLQAGPDAWCPTGDDFLRWLDARAALAGPTRRVSAKRHGDTPRTWLQDGVVVMEDDGTLMRFDRRPDLAGMTLLLTPASGGYTSEPMPLAYEPDIGAQVLTDARSFASTPVDLTALTFPFGGTDRIRLFLTSNLQVAFVDPVAPAAGQLHLLDLIADRTPRIAPLEQGTSLLGWNAFFREAADRAVVTWRAAEGGWLDLDVQVVLFPDGRIQLSYARTEGAQHGSVVVVDGNDAFWSDRRPAGSVTNPGSEVMIPPPDGPAVDVVEVRGLQVSGSELLDVEVVVEAPLPADTDGTLQFAIELRDEPGGPVFATIWAEWQDGRFNWTNTAMRVAGNVLSFTLLRSDMPLTDDDVNVVAWTAQNWAWQQAVGADLAYPSTPPVPLMKDFSAGIVTGLGEPLLEAFTLPELLVGAVHDAFARHFESPRIDALAIYQSFNTDIVLYAGAYSTVGNAGADGIGTGNTTDPESPALLHMNTVRYGWNSWDSGKVTVLNHELGHHWLYFLSILEDGVVGKPLGDGHPAGWVHAPAAAPVVDPLDASCMGGSTWRDNLDGTFTSPPGFVSIGYSWHELYLMGLADPTEVPDWFYLRDSDPPLPGAYWPPADLTVTATRRDVALQQVVDALGPRNPPRGSSRTDFLVPMVLVVRPGEIPPDDVAEVARTCDVWAPQFSVATVGRGSVTCDRVGYRPPVPRITDPPDDIVVRAGDTVSFTGTADDPDEDPVVVTWDWDGLQPRVTGEGPHLVTFTEVGTFVVLLNARDATGAVADFPDVRVVRVTCRDPEEVTGLRLTRADADASFTWTAEALPPDEHVVLSSTSPSTGFEEVAVGESGLPVTTLPGLWFFKVAGRNAPDCLGPY
jgi:hypothetical protein